MNDYLPVPVYTAKVKGLFPIVVLVGRPGVERGHQGPDPARATASVPAVTAPGTRSSLPGRLSRARRFGRCARPGHASTPSGRRSRLDAQCVSLPSNPPSVGRQFAPRGKISPNGTLVTTGAVARFAANVATRNTFDGDSSVVRTSTTVPRIESRTWG